MDELNFSFEMSLKSEANCLKRYPFAKSNFQKSGILSSLVSANEIFAIYYLCKKNDLYLAKKHYSLSAAVYLYGIKIGLLKVVLSLPSFLNALVSDNKVLINECLNTVNRLGITSEKTIDFSCILGIQGVLASDEELVSDSIFEISNAYKSYKYSSGYSGWAQALSGLINEDKTTIENGVINLLETQKLRGEEYETKYKFISPVPLGVLKLARIKGIEINIDHPLIKNDLLPIWPLDTYEIYKMMSK